MNKLPFDSPYTEAFRGDYYSDGIRPGDPPRVGLFIVLCTLAVFAGIGLVAKYIF